MFVFFFFFFSSRRRHTRWNCDWSSDVCSSDLATPAQLEAIAKAVHLADAAFANARTVVGALSDSASIVEGLNQAATKLSDIRAATDRALGVPLSARDAAAVKGFLPGVAQVVATIEPVLNRI